MLHDIDKQDHIQPMKQYSILFCDCIRLMVLCEEGTSNLVNVTAANLNKIDL